MIPNATFSLTLTKVDMPLFAGQVVSVSVPGTEGDMTILAHHEPLVSLLKAGTISVNAGGEKEESYPIDGGVLEVSNNQVTILL